MPQVYGIPRSAVFQGGAHCGLAAVAVVGCVCFQYVQWSSSQARSARTHTGHDREQRMASFLLKLRDGLGSGPSEGPGDLSSTTDAPRFRGCVTMIQWIGVAVGTVIPGCTASALLFNMSN